MADKRSFEEIVNSFPGCREELIEIYRKMTELNNAMSKLDEKYPVDGWTWDMDLNRIGLYDEEFKKDPCLENTAWTMYNTETKEEANNKYRALLDRQIKCAHGNHEWVQFGETKWCKFCGTLITKSFAMDNSEMLISVPEIHYPESPHYLPKEESKDETDTEDKELVLQTQQ